LISGSGPEVSEEGETVFFGLASFVLGVDATGVETGVGIEAAGVATGMLFTTGAGEEEEEAVATGASVCCGTVEIGVEVEVEADDGAFAAEATGVVNAATLFLVVDDAFFGAI
jgi:hypothetical protein